MSVDFANVLNTLKNGVITLAEKDLKDYVASATKDGQAVLDTLKDDLKNWTQELVSGQLSEDDFKDLVLGQKDELEMVALKEAGLAEIQVDQFKIDVFNLITTTICALIP
jgi:hypothetical protein